MAGQVNVEILAIDKLKADPLAKSLCAGLLLVLLLME